MQRIHTQLSVYIALMHVTMTADTTAPKEPILMLDDSCFPPLLTHAGIQDFDPT